MCKDEVNDGVEAVFALPNSSNDHDDDLANDSESQLSVAVPENPVSPKSAFSLSSKQKHDSNSRRASFVPTASFKTPEDTLKAVYKAGIYKAGLSLNVLCVQSIMAGIYISIGGQTFLSLGGGVLGAIFFPTGLIAVGFSSATLFTGDSLIFIASVLGNKVSIFKLLRTWIVSWFFNFAGCLIWAAVLGYASGALNDVGQSDFAVQFALKKANEPWMHIFLKGIGANFLVCLGTWQATCAEDAAGKIIALWFPVAAFVIMGFDHVIANQFYITLGMMLGADISIVHLLFKALLPATLGNILGGGICLGAVNWYVFDSIGSTPNAYLFTRTRWQQSLRRPARYAEEDSGVEATNSCLDDESKHE